MCIAEYMHDNFNSKTSANLAINRFNLQSKYFLEYFACGHELLSCITSKNKTKLHNCNIHPNYKLLP